MSGLYEELKRRNVFRVATVYVIFAWLFLQVVALAVDGFGAPGWVTNTFAVVLVIGFPIALFLAWAFELTPEGIMLEKNVDRSKSIAHNTGKRLDFMIIGILLIALAYSLIIRFEQGGDTNRPPIVDHTMDQETE